MPYYEGFSGASRFLCSLFGTAFGRPFRFNDLLRAAESKRIFGYIFCDAGTGGHVRAVGKSERGDEGGVRSDEDTVADSGLRLVHAVVVAGDDTGADIHTASDDGIAEIGEVVGLGALAERGLLG